jgi:hypothetical protein
MSMATVNLLLGFDAILFTVAFVLKGLIYAIESIRSPRRSRWNLLIAIGCVDLAWTFWPGVGQDFARASDVVLLSHPADAGGVLSVIISTALCVLLLALDVDDLRRLRQPTAQA